MPSRRARGPARRPDRPGREPFGRGYFGDPCSTGPSEFLWYFPVQVSTLWFGVVPGLSMLLSVAAGSRGHAPDR